MKYKRLYYCFVFYRDPPPKKKKRKGKKRNNRKRSQFCDIDPVDLTMIKYKDDVVK